MVSRRLQRDDVRSDIERLERRILEGPGVVSEADRRRAFAKEPIGNAELDAYVDRVHRHAYRITDEEIGRLRRAGMSEDALFEITIAAALGAGAARLDAGLEAIAAAYEEGVDR